MSRKSVSKESDAVQISPWQKWYMAPAILIVAVCLANVLYLAHVSNPNPLLTRSNLGLRHSLPDKIGSMSVKVPSS